MTPGEVAYRAYADALRAGGIVVPPWKDAPQVTRDAFDAVARAVRASSGSVEDRRGWERVFA